MAILKKRDQQSESRLLLEAGEPVDLPPAEIEDRAVIVQFDNFKPFVSELLAVLRAGTLAEPVPVMLDGSTFAVDGETRTFWIKLWHASKERTRIERAQVISCLPRTPGVRIRLGGDDAIDDASDYLEEEEDDDDDDDELDQEEAPPKED